MKNTRRFEVKIPIPLSRLNHVLNWLKLHPLLFRKKHPDRSVNSLYLDSANLDVYEENLSGICNRKKIRIRWYDELFDSKDSKLEFKYREAGKGYKVTYPVNLDIRNSDKAWYHHLLSCQKVLSIQANNLWGNNQYPVLICRYQREYFESLCGSMRATFDRNIEVYDQRYQGIPNLVTGRSLGEYVLLELKTDESFEKELAALVAACPLRPSRHSKYVNGIRALTWF
ncbi:polyphosphate polymerase domain-containing protein [Pseudoalteromonas denitrificans]|uniref:VTC domain-containing protein n=1 Tax=Pseudoalteromonas denitrificans DSM 6059 TaxID=1123010 RepID=A0A1I1EPB2_9GAMM|nr:polyphosphate polymerase domain-containing protein [Pseudoalteromonas denitrificans]SFB88857.1 VTC domain-containing protein [Pseudoalteromonas denitrificans DSM 6059]